MSDHKKTACLNDLSSILVKEGYRYASFIKNIKFLEKFVCFSIPPLGSNAKPGQSLYFSEISTDGKEITAPEWYRSVISNDNAVSYYESQDITFAEIDFKHIVLQSNPGFDEDGGKYISIDSHSLLPSINWNMVAADGWKGVHVTDPREGFWEDAGWDVPTVAIWDCMARNSKSVTKFMSFENAGAWKYDSHPIDVFPRPK